MQPSRYCRSIPKQLCLFLSSQIYISIAESKFEYDLIRREILYTLVDAFMVVYKAIFVLDVKNLKSGFKEQILNNRVNVVEAGAAVTEKESWAYLDEFFEEVLERENRGEWRPGGGGKRRYTMEAGLETINNYQVRFPFFRPTIVLVLVCQKCHLTTMAYFENCSDRIELVRCHSH